MKNNSGPQSNAVPPSSKNPQQAASRSKRLFTRFFNFRAWSDWERSKFITQFFLAMVERFWGLRQKSTSTEESFASAVKKYQLDDKALAAKALGLKRLSYTLLLMALFLFCYGFYQLFYGSRKGFLIAMVEVLLALVLAFRYHFWSFQIARRQLGCSVTDWFKASFMGGRR